MSINNNRQGQVLTSCKFGFKVTALDNSVLKNMANAPKSPLTYFNDEGGGGGGGRQRLIFHTLKNPNF